MSIKAKILPVTPYSNASNPNLIFKFLKTTHLHLYSEWCQDTD